MKEDRRIRMEQAKEMYLKKMKVKDIAKEMGLAMSTISEYITDAGVRKIKSADVQKSIVELHKQGKTYTQISNELEISKTYVSKVMKQLGLGRKSYKAEDEEMLKNVVYAPKKDFSKPLEKINYNGTRYEVINQLIFPES